MSGPEPLRARLARVDWAAVESSLATRAHARLGTLLTRAECQSLIEAYAEPARWRKRIDMERHGFGIGSYAYFARPLPRLVEALRRAAYPPLAGIANRWMEALGSPERFPPHLRELLDRCRAEGQAQPTPLVLHYREGGYNALHQDIYGPVAFPLQLVVLLSRPGEDFEGGDLLLVEQRPRAQSVGEAVALLEGEAAVFATRHRPVAGRRGHHRASVRHGVSRLLRGERYTLGIIFHDARS